MSLLLLSAVLVSASDTQVPVHGSKFAFITYVDAREGADLFGGFWANTKNVTDVGNIYAFEQLLLFADQGAVLGQHSGYCIRTDPGNATGNATDNLLLQDNPTDNFQQCTWTVTFGSNGTLTAGNTLQLMARLADVQASRAAIVGGTGKFMGAYGWATYTPEAQTGGGSLIRQAFNFSIDIETFSGATAAPATSAPSTFAPSSGYANRVTVVRMANTTVAEIQRGMIAYQARLREVAQAGSATCNSVCSYRRAFRSRTFVQEACFPCFATADRDAEVLQNNNDNELVYDVTVTINTRFSQVEVNRIISANFRYITAAISTSVTFTSTDPVSDNDDDLANNAVGIFAIVLISVVIIGVVVVFFLCREKKTPEIQSTEPVEEEEVEKEA